MDNKSLTILIDGRVALPVRAIPHVTAWHRFSPDVVAWYLAQDVDRFTEWDIGLTAYHLCDGVPVPVLPREWDAVVASLDGLDAETRTSPDAQGYALWREQSVQKLPAGVFVWLDEFEPVYRARCQRVQDEDRRPSNLTLSPLLDDVTIAMVREGLSRSVSPAMVPETQTAPATDVVEATSDGSAPPTGVPAVPNWKMQVQTEATALCLRLRKSGASPTKKSIVESLARWCRDNDVKTDTKIFPSANYLRTHVLGGAHWDLPN